MGRLNSPKNFSTCHTRRERTPNEARAFIILRRKGYSINKLAQIFGRSTSMIHRVLKFNGLVGAVMIGGPYDRHTVLHAGDMRKSSGTGLTIESIFRSNRWTQLFQKWVQFAKGEEDEPP